MYIRLLYVMLVALLRNKSMAFSGESVLHFTVMPWDCVVRYVGNDRYHAFMDLGRVDLLIRLGALEAILTEKLQPFVFTADIRFQSRLGMFQRFRLRTRLIHSDKKFFLMEHIFQCGKKVMATAVSKNGLASNEKIVSTFALLEHIRWQHTRCDPTNLAVIEAIEQLLRKIYTV